MEHNQGVEPDRSAIEAAADLLTDRRIAVLTGAGISTDSGIPDYRGEGARERNPMTFQEFRDDPQKRQRYWAGSHIGWTRFGNALPNHGHWALARLEKRGFVNGVITQNVDGLHARAGSRRIVDVHGSMNRVRCLKCGRMFPRTGVAARIRLANPWLMTQAEVVLAPDGDADASHVDDFVVPECAICGGLLKPDVVFFGELVPKSTFAQATDVIETADALLIAGSSLVVNTGIRLLELARRREVPIVIINRGTTAGDSRATVKLDAGTSQSLAALEARLVSGR